MQVFHCYHFEVGLECDGRNKSLDFLPLDITNEGAYDRIVESLLYKLLNRYRRLNPDQLSF